MAKVEERTNQLNDQTLLSYSILFALFVGGLVLTPTLGMKIADIYGFYVPAGIFLWCMTFPLTDIVAETYGRRYALYMVLGAGVFLILSMFMVQFAIALPSAPFWKNDQAFNTILGANIRTTLALVISFFITQVVDIYIFSWLRRKTNGRFLWLRNNASTFFSQILANCIFLSIAFLGTIPLENWMSLFITNLIARFALAFLDTPIVYAGVSAVKRIHPQLETD